jgi:hypothetical protein
VIAVLIASLAWGQAVPVPHDRPENWDFEPRPCLQDCGRLIVALGSHRIMNFDFEIGEGADHIRVGRLDVVATTLVKTASGRRQVTFLGLKAGETTVTLRGPGGDVVAFYKILVTPVDIYELGHSLSKRMEQYPGIQVQPAGGKVAVVGRAASPEDYGGMLQVITTQPYLDYVINQVQISPLYWDLLAQKAQTEGSLAAGDAVRVRALNGILIVEGTVGSNDAAQKAVERIKLLLPAALPADPIQMKDPGARVLPARSLIQNFLKVR